jgi:hypothetical protein
MCIVIGGRSMAVSFHQKLTPVGNLPLQGDSGTGGA